MRIVLVILILVLLSCSTTDKESQDIIQYKNHKVSAKQLKDSLGLVNSDLHILISKSDYKLSLLHKNEVIKEYPIVLGKNPIDDKRMEGDRCTPEGVFKIRDLYPHKSWSKFIWIDYPTKDSQEKFLTSKKEGEIPKDATIGGEVGIHGVPKGKDYLIQEKQNWTWGCISLMNKDVNDLYAVCYKGMKIEILK